MATIQFNQNAPSMQVDDFPNSIQRTKPGALYVKPNKLVELNDDELKHLEKNHSQLYSKIRLVEYELPVMPVNKRAPVFHASGTLDKVKAPVIVEDVKPSSSKAVKQSSSKSSKFKKKSAVKKD